MRISLLNLSVIFIAIFSSCKAKNKPANASDISRINVVVKHDFRPEGFKTSEFSILDKDSIKTIWDHLNFKTGDSQRGVRVLSMDAIVEFSLADQLENNVSYLVFLRSDHGTFVQEYYGGNFKALIRSEFNVELEKCIDAYLLDRGIRVNKQ